MTLLDLVLLIMLFPKVVDFGLTVLVLVVIVSLAVQS